MTDCKLETIATLHMYNLHIYMDVKQSHWNKPHHAN